MSPAIQGNAGDSSKFSLRLLVLWAKITTIKQLITLHKIGGTKSERD
jgi:hypothetical protein